MTDVIVRNANRKVYLFSDVMLAFITPAAIITALATGFISNRIAQKVAFALAFFTVLNAAYVIYSAYRYYKSRTKSIEDSVQSSPYLNTLIISTLAIGTAVMLASWEVQFGTPMVGIALCAVAALTAISYVCVREEIYDTLKICCLAIGVAAAVMYLVKNSAAIIKSPELMLLSAITVLAGLLVASLVVDMAVKLSNKRSRATDNGRKMNEEEKKAAAAQIREQFCKFIETISNIVSSSEERKEVDENASLKKAITSSFSNALAQSGVQDLKMDVAVVVDTPTDVTHVTLAFITSYTLPSDKFNVDGPYQNLIAPGSVSCPSAPLTLISADGTTTPIGALIPLASSSTALQTSEGGAVSPLGLSSVESTSIVLKAFFNGITAVSKTPDQSKLQHNLTTVVQNLVVSGLSHGASAVGIKNVAAGFSITPGSDGCFAFTQVMTFSVPLAHRLNTAGLRKITAGPGLIGDAAINPDSTLQISSISTTATIEELPSGSNAPNRDM